MDNDADQRTGGCDAVHDNVNRQIIYIYIYKFDKAISIFSFKPLCRFLYLEETTVSFRISNF